MWYADAASVDVNLTSISPGTPRTATPTGFGVYKLPTFPADITASLSAGSTGIVRCRADRSPILQVLYDDLRARVGL